LLSALPQEAARASAGSRARNALRAAHPRAGDLSENPSRSVLRATATGFLRSVCLTITQGALMNMFAPTARAFEEKKGQALGFCARRPLSPATNVRAHRRRQRLPLGVLLQERRRSYGRLHPWQNHGWASAKRMGVRPLLRATATWSAPSNMPRASRPRGRLRFGGERRPSSSIDSATKTTSRRRGAGNYN
jgi:hypothetical protein